VADIAPGGPAAKCGAVAAGDTLVAVDPGRDASHAHWQYEQVGNRRWIDVRGWPEGKVLALMEGDAGTSLWLRLRRGERDVVAHVTRGPPGSALFPAHSLDLELVTPDGGRVAVPAELAMAIKGVRAAFEPDFPGPTRAYPPSLPSAPPPLEPRAGPAPRGCSAPAPTSAGPAELPEKAVPVHCARPARGHTAANMSFEIVGGGALCSAESVRAVLAHLDAGYASAHGLAPHQDLAGAVRALVSLPDPRVMAKRLERRVAGLQEQLAATEAALDDAREHLEPLLRRPELGRHAQLAVVLGHARLAMQQLEHDRATVLEALATKECQQTACRLSLLRTRAGWAGMPSVVTWAGTRSGVGLGAPGTDAGGGGGGMGEDMERARGAVLERLERVCVDLAVAGALQVTRVVHRLARQVADALVECEDAEQLLSAVGIDSDLPLLPEERADIAGALHQACRGDPDGASPLTTAVCRAIVARVAGRSPLHRLGEGLLVAVAAQMEDSGWRLCSGRMRLEDRGVRRRGGDEITCLVHRETRVLLQFRHGTRHAHFQFRAAAGSEVFGCDCRGVVEAATLLAVEVVTELEDPRGRARRVPPGGLGQVGEWRTSEQRGRLVWTNGGSALHVLRSGGFVFLPSKDGAAAVLLEDGWVRPIARHDAVARLMPAPT
jgi:hypothetical protein